jgi:hypothetical protein
MKTDVRYIKGVSYGVSVPKSWDEKGISLCEYCAAQNFCGTALSSPNDPISGCDATILPLTFQDKTGLHRQYFSTIRLGKAWGERLSAISGIVALVHKTKTKETVLGFADAIHHVTVPKDEAIKSFRT